MDRLGVGAGWLYHIPAGLGLQAWANFVLEMQRAASECERTVAVLSPDYLASAFTQPEWAAAFAGDPTGKSQKLIPVRVRPCELVGLLKSVVYIDLRRAVLHPRASHPCSPRARPVASVRTSRS